MPGEGKPVSDTKVIAGPDSIKAAMHKAFIFLSERGFQTGHAQTFRLAADVDQTEALLWAAKNGYTWPAVRWTGRWRRVESYREHGNSVLVAA